MAKHTEEEEEEDDTETTPETLCATKKRVRRELTRDPDYDDLEFSRRRRAKRNASAKAEARRGEEEREAPNKHWSIERFSAYCDDNGIDIRNIPELRAIHRAIKNRESAAESRRRKQLELEKLTSKVKKYKRLLKISAETILALKAKVTELSPARDPPSPEGSPDGSEESIPETLSVCKLNEGITDYSGGITDDLQKYLMHDPLSERVCPFLE